MALEQSYLLGIRAVIYLSYIAGTSALLKRLQIGFRFLSQTRSHMASVITRNELAFSAT